IYRSGYVLCCSKIQCNRVLPFFGSSPVRLIYLCSFSLSLCHRYHPSAKYVKAFSRPKRTTAKKRTDTRAVMLAKTGPQGQGQLGGPFEPKFPEMAALAFVTPLAPRPRPARSHPGGRFGRGADAGGIEPGGPGAGGRHRPSPLLPSSKAQGGGQGGGLGALRGGVGDSPQLSERPTTHPGASRRRRLRAGLPVLLLPPPGPARLGNRRPQGLSPGGGLPGDRLFALGKMIVGRGPGKLTKNP